jgi:hypothetical protein
LVALVHALDYPGYRPTDRNVAASKEGNRG